ncbi:MAG TPA: PrpF domain-containing protein [Candidatus Methylomirabilis sp.]|nr:PrpF domain-containing protein [Candidatus Methylomirabilis sp.]
MTQRRIRAVYMRGGTSRCLVFHEQDLPTAGPERDHVLLAGLGSPDPYGRQLDGLGGGISSLSKACIIGPPSHPDAQVDYTFAQVEVSKPVVDYTGNCGNCSSSVGPFAIDEHLVPSTDGLTVVRIHNTNTKKLIVAHVPVAGGEASVEGDFELPGVAGRGARIALDFIDPGGAGTGRLLPTGNARDTIDGVAASCVDATNPVVFVRAKDLGLSGAETPQAMDADRDLAARLEKIRTTAAEMMGIPGSAANPKVAVVAPRAAFAALDGARYSADQVDLLARVISMGNCHRAFALTSAMCLAVAARIDGTVVRECDASRHGDVRLGHPSGVLPIAASVGAREGRPYAERVTVYRTARRLMEGFVRVP